MKNFIASEAYANAKNWAEKLSESLQRMSVLLEASMQSEEEIPLNLVCEDAENAYISALEVAKNMQKIFEAGSEVCSEKAENTCVENVKIASPEAKFCNDTGAVSCTFFAPPTTKKHAANRVYLDLLCRELPQKIVEVLPQNFMKLTAVNVIYVNHFQRSETRKQPYFDNDNLAIKGILDMIIPLLCVDDAYIFCSNFYVAQPDEENFSEVIVVPRGHLLEWARSRPDLEFAKELGVR